MFYQKASQMSIGWHLGKVINVNTNNFINEHKKVHGTVK